MPQWRLAKYARRELFEFYGTACCFNQAAYVDLKTIKTLSDEECIIEARAYGLIE